MKRSAASTSGMSRFETETLIQLENLEFLMSLPGRLGDRVHEGKGLTEIILDTDSFIGETYGDPERACFAMVMSIVPMMGRVC